MSGLKNEARQPNKQTPAPNQLGSSQSGHKKVSQTLELFDRSMKRWGFPSQILMLVEELNELSVASLHLLRKTKVKRESLERFAEEIADVELMIEEMKHYFQNYPHVLKYRQAKLERLKRVLEAAQ